jgi:hypothetical protein
MHTIPISTPQEGREAGPEGLWPSSLDYLYKNNRNSLDSQNKKRPPFCGKYTVAGPGKGPGAGHKFVALKCKSWACPVCGPKKQRRLRQALTRTALEWKLNRFLTLTLSRKFCTARESLAYIKACWAKMRIYLKRRYGASITFVWFLELQKAGYAHLHILIDRYMPQAWVKAAWEAIGGGSIVDLEQVQMERVAGYLTKYLTKDLGADGIAKGQRRYGNSRNIHLFAKAGKTGWKIIWGGLPHLRQKLAAWVIAEGLDEEAKLGWFETLHPPEDILGPYSFPAVQCS